MDDAFLEENYEVYNLINPFAKDFRFLYGKKPFTVPANGSLPVPAAVGKHGAKKMIDKLIEFKEGFPKVNDVGLRRKYLELVLKNVELEDIQDVPQAKKQVDASEGLMDTVTQVVDKEEAPREVMGENDSPDVPSQTNSSAEDDEVIDLNAKETTPEDLSEEELRMEALKDSDPVKYRAWELENMEWNALRAFAKEKGIEGKDKETYIQGILKVEFPGSTII